VDLKLEEEGVEEEEDVVVDKVVDKVVVVVLQAIAHHRHRATWLPRGWVVAGVVARCSARGIWRIKKLAWTERRLHLHRIVVQNHFIKNRPDHCIEIQAKGTLCWQNQVPRHSSRSARRLGQ
jgi:hypothetical protein